MKFTELYQKYLEILWQCFLYDVEVFSKPWLYSWLVPVMFYLCFFMVKWCVLTFPIWFPAISIFHSLAALVKAIKK